MDINDKILNRNKYAEMKQEIVDRERIYVNDVMGMQDLYYKNTNNINDVNHLVEFSDELSASDKVKLLDLNRKLRKDRRAIKDFINLTVKLDARRLFFSANRVEYTKDDIIMTGILRTPDDRVYTMRSNDDDISNFLDGLKSIDKKYPNVITSVSDDDLNELKEKFK